MGREAELILLACVLALIVPLMVMVLRRMIRGERFEKPKMGDMHMPPPSGPPLDGGGT